MKTCYESVIATHSVKVHSVKCISASALALYFLVLSTRTGATQYAFLILHSKVLMIQAWFCVFMLLHNEVFVHLVGDLCFLKVEKYKVVEQIFYISLHLQSQTPSVQYLQSAGEQF